jgi:hypothetical protein
MHLSVPPPYALLLADRAFQGFLEGPISFKPTYRYIAGADAYDRRPDGKLRCPSWCDRILWRLSPPAYYPHCPLSAPPLRSSSGITPLSGGAAGEGCVANPLAKEIQWGRSVSLEEEEGEGKTEKVQFSSL